MQIDNDVVHTVNFFQTAFMIVLSLSLGEALKSFASDNQNHPLYWDRAPALLAFLLVFFPFFQSMSQYLYVTYLNPRTALEFYPGYLVFDGLMFTLEAGCFFVMSRSLAPRIWRRFYASTLTLMAIDIGWTSVNFFRGVHVGDWLWLDIVVVVALLTLIWFERGRPPSMRPSYVGLAIVAVTTALSYWLERDIYFPLNETKAVLNPHQETPMRNETTVPVQHVKIVLAQPFDTARAAFEAILPKLNTESISLLEAGDVDRARQLLELGPGTFDLPESRSRARAANRRPGEEGDSVRRRKSAHGVENDQTPTACRALCPISGGLVRGRARPRGCSNTTSPPRSSGSLETRTSGRSHWGWMLP